MATKQQGADRLVCPACQSEIASDGAKLFKRSKRLEELEETAGIMEKLDLDSLEKELTELRGENRRLRTAPVLAGKKGEDRDAELKR